MHLLERDKALLLNPEERAFSYRYVRSAEPKASGAFQQLQNCVLGGGLSSRGNLKTGTSPRNQVPGLELSTVSRGCQIGKYPKNMPRYPCQRRRLGCIQTRTCFRAPKCDDLGAEALRVPRVGNLTRET